MGARARLGGVMLRQIDLLPRLNGVVARSVFSNATGHGRPLGVNPRGVAVRDTSIIDPTATVSSRSSAGGRSCGRRMPTVARQCDRAGPRYGRGRCACPASRRGGNQPCAVVGDGDGLATCPVTEPLEILEIRDGTRRCLPEPAGILRCCCGVGWAATNADPLRRPCVVRSKRSLVGWTMEPASPETRGERHVSSAHPGGNPW